MAASDSPYSAAREPEDDEWQNLLTLDDILAWANIGGAMDYMPSQRGSLVIAAGGDAATTIQEFAAIPIDQFLYLIDNLWTYSNSQAAGDIYSQDMTTNLINRILR